MDSLKTIKTIVEYVEIILDDFPSDYFDKTEESMIPQIKERINKCHIYKIKYISDGLKINGYIVQPKDIVNNVKLPVIIWNRGGNADFGNIHLRNIVNSFCIMAEAGYVVIGSDYRGAPESEGNDELGGSDINDVINLKHIIDELPYVDNTKIGMYGASRGGIMIYEALCKVSWVKAAVVKAGVSNVVRQTDLRPEMQEVFDLRFGGSEQEKINRSAIYWVDKFPKDVPILLMHGTADWRVSPLDTLDIATLFYKQKIPYRLVMFEGGDHALSEYIRTERKYTIEWFDKFLKNSETLPNLEPHGL